MSGEFDKAQGRAKQAAGDLTGNKKLKREGKGDETAGKVKRAADKAEDRVDEAVDKVRGKGRSGDRRG